MSDSSLALTDPRLLLQAARVFNVADANFRKAAATVAEQALSALKMQRKEAPASVEPEVEQAIVGDCAALRLAGRVDGGYKAAEELLTEQIDKRPPAGRVDGRRNDINGRLHLLRALAKGQAYKEYKNDHPSEQPSDANMINLREAIAKDLEFAFAQNPRLEEINRPFWRPDAKQADEADLALAYDDGPELARVIPADNTEGNPARSDERIRPSSLSDG
jgi:hypothetical protein